MPVIHVTIALLFVAGLALIAFGLRGRRVGDHPYCARCGFDLFGLEADAARCPECGADASARKSVVVGTRCRRWEFVIGGSLLTVISSTAIGIAIWAAATQFNWNSIKPTWLLVQEAQGGDQVLVDTVLSELLSRLRADGISERHQAALVELSLAVQADEQRAWTEAWAELAGLLLLGGAMSEEQAITHGRQGVETTFRVRPRARTGSTLPMPIEISADRVALAGNLLLQFRVDSIRFGDRRIARGGRGSQQRQVFGSSWRGSFGPNVPLEQIETGRHTVTGEWTISLLDAADPERPAIASWRVQHEAEIEIVGPDGDDIGMVSNPDLDALMARLIRVREARIRRSRGQAMPQGMVDFRNLPINVAFDVYWRVGEDEWRIGEVTRTADSGRHSTHYSAFKEMPGFDAETVTVILRPSADAARRTPDMTEVWGGELVFEDMRIYHDHEMPEFDIEAERWWVDEE